MTEKLKELAGAYYADFCARCDREFFELLGDDPMVDPLLERDHFVVEDPDEYAIPVCEDCRRPGDVVMAVEHSPELTAALYDFGTEQMEALERGMAEIRRRR